MQKENQTPTEAKTMSTELFTPENLKRWTRPQCYAGAEWPDYYSAGVGQSRDSGALERSNFAAMLDAIGGEQAHETLEDPNDEGAALSLVRVVRESHWAVGWVEWIAIHESATEALQIADKLKGKLENYPVLDEEHYCQLETEEANEVWKNCYRPNERVEYVRKHRSQFEFRGLADMLGCIRGNYFAGYASELLH